MKKLETLISFTEKYKKYVNKQEITELIIPEQVVNERILLNLNEVLSENEYHSICHIQSLVQCSLQYCFFYGNSKVRLDSIDSTWLHNTVTKALGDSFDREIDTTMINEWRKNIINELMSSNISMIRNRIQTINDVMTDDLINYGFLHNNIESSLNYMNTLIPFRQDFFFKKAILAIYASNNFIHHNDRKYLEEFMNLPVPADYQIPKMLRAMNLIDLPKSITDKIDNDEFFIPESEDELIIRGSALQACEMIKDVHGVSVQVIDNWLFSIRNDKDYKIHKHHLCITENY